MKHIQKNQLIGLLNRKDTLLILFMVYVFIAGIHLRAVYTKSLNESSDHALHIANTVVKSINLNRLMLLQATNEDTANTYYTHYKNKLIELHKINQDARFLYFLKKNGERIFFMVDSEPTSSNDYSAPGDEYINELDTEILISFKTHEPLVSKPTQDKWGNWVTIYVPIKNQKTQQYDMLFCMDYDAEFWYKKAWLNVLQASMMLLAVLLFLLSIYFIFKKNIKLRKSILQLIETKKELESAKEMSEAASVAKSHFLSNMSHEIRTPLNGVIGFTELLRNTPLTKNQNDYLENAITSANSLLGVINDILDFSKIESGKMELEQVKTDIFVLLENAADIIKIMTAKKGLELLLNVQPDMPRYLYIDPIRTKQILVNLLSNAVKFTHAGEVELKVSFEKMTKRIGKVYFSVRDTGIGIKENDKKKLFKSFSQADTSTTRKYGGTGLGLIISNSLAEKMGGKINFESTPGEGTTFGFSFETGYESGSKQAGNGIEDVKSVLVIDDNLNNRTILEYTLMHWGIKFTGAESGAAGLELLSHKNRYDLIIVDYHMPEMNGMDTIKLIREMLDETNYEQPIMMLHSSSDDVSLFESAKKYRVRFMLTKPIKQDELYNYLCNLYHAEIVDNQLNDSDTVTDETSLANETAAYNQFKILVAEDTEMNMLVISNMLRNIIPNVKIVEALNGTEAVGKFISEKPDLILMDVQMPELDGVGATLQIREIKESKHVSIIALTAGVSKEEREACFEAGMEDFLAKPIVVDELKRILDNYLFTKKIHTRSSKKFNNAKSLIHFDKEKLLTKIGNEDTMQTILKMSLQEYPKYLAELADAIERFDVDMIKRFAHKLKGSALNMEFVALGEIAQLIEEKSEDIKEVQQLNKLLKQEWKVVSTLLV